MKHEGKHAIEICVLHCTQPTVYSVDLKTPPGTAAKAHAGYRSSFLSTHTMWLTPAMTPESRESNIQFQSPKATALVCAHAPRD